MMERMWAAMRDCATDINREAARKQKKIYVPKKPLSAKEKAKIRPVPGA